MAGERITVIANVGCEALADTLDLAQHAELAGAKAIATMAPVFFRPTGVDVLAAWLTEVGKVAPTMPLYYYHLKSVCDFRMDQLLEAVHGRIPTFRWGAAAGPGTHTLTRRHDTPHTCALMHAHMHTHHHHPCLPHLTLMPSACVCSSWHPYPSTTHKRQLSQPPPPPLPITCRCMGWL